MSEEQNNQVEKVPIPMGPNGVKLESFDQMWRFSVAVSRSQFKPKGMERPEDIMLALQMGAELGLTPLNALQSIAVINGRPGVFGDAALSLVRGSGLCEHYAQVVAGEGDERTAEVASKRKGHDSLLTRFSVADAKKAGLWGKTGPWTQYPDRMLMFRARGFNLRDNFGDVLKGFKTTEELQDYPTDYAKDARVIAETTYRDEPNNQPSPVDGVPPKDGAVVQKRGRGRPPGSTKKTEEKKEEINETPQPLTEPAQSVAEPAEQNGEKDSNVVAGAPSVLESIRAELERTGKSEQRLMSVLNTWKLTKNPATPLDEVDSDTLGMVWKRFSTIAPHL